MADNRVWSYSVYTVLGFMFEVVVFLTVARTGLLVEVKWEVRGLHPWRMRVSDLEIHILDWILEEAFYWSKVKENGWLLEMYKSTLFSSEEVPLTGSQEGPEAHGDNLDCQETLDPLLVLGPRLPQKA